MHLLCLHFFFYIVFVHYLWNFYLNLANKRRRKVIIRRVWLLRSPAVTTTWRQSNVTSANQLLHLSMTSLTRNVAWTSVVHGCMNLVGPKEVHLRKLLASVNIDKCNSWLADVTFDSRQVIVTAVERNHQTRRIITFLCRLFARFKSKFHNNAKNDVKKKGV